MKRLRQLLMLLASSVALLVTHFVVARFNERFGLWQSLRSLSFLGYLHGLGIPALSRSPVGADWSDTSQFPWPTNLGEWLVVGGWFALYFLISFLALAVARSLWHCARRSSNHALQPTTGRSDV